MNLDDLEAEDLMNDFFETFNIETYCPDVPCLQAC
ncbi:hypothetical protein ACFL9S_09675 [Erwinia sp. AnSW2-5]